MRGINKPKGGSLFDGIGGWPLAGSKFGIDFVWSSEIEPFPISVTKKHFPNMKHLGDLTKINGAEIEPVDVITFGSPCQDLSVAGKRAGMAGKRSGLFMEAVRIIREMRDSTDGKYPRFAVWENVPGAFSSNKGDDFRAVLEEITESKIPIPSSSKWATAGMVRGNRVEVAWRQLDAQHWGVPQRRKRIFLVADFGGECAGEILFKPESVSRHIKTCGGEGERVAGGVAVGVRTAGFKPRNSSEAHSIGYEEEVYLTLSTSNNEAIIQAIGFKANSNIADNAPVLDECIPPLQTTSRMAVCFGADLSQKAEGIGLVKELSVCLTAGTHAGHGSHVVHPLITGTLCASDAGMSRPAGMASETDLIVAYNLTFCDANGRRSDRPNGGLYINETDKSGTITAKTTGYETAIVNNYAVRRLTPTECLRLQGLPDWWFDDIPGNSDTACYKGTGNGMAQPCPDYVMEGIVEVLKFGS